MVKLAEKERDSLEVCLICCTLVPYLFSDLCGGKKLHIWQDVKNEAEAYMLKELLHLKWQEKATKLAFEDNGARSVEVQEKLSSLEESLKGER